MATGMDPRDPGAVGSAIRTGWEPGPGGPMEPPPEGDYRRQTCRTRPTAAALLRRHPFSSHSGHAQYLRRTLADAVLSHLVLRRHAFHRRSVGLGSAGARYVLRPPI